MPQYSFNEMQRPPGSFPQMPGNPQMSTSGMQAPSLGMQQPQLGNPGYSLGMPQPSFPGSGSVTSPQIGMQQGPGNSLGMPQPPQNFPSYQQPVAPTMASGGRLQAGLPPYQEDEYGSGSGLGRLEKMNWPLPN
jgi:hypothetical protein